MTTLSASSAPSLARRLGLASLILYGVGDILGAGIYALVGKVTAVAGQGAWVSFLISALLAGLTGLTYAEWSARVPRSAGAAAYTAAAFRRPWATFLIGFFVLASGLTSAATVSLAFQGYLSVFLSVPPVAAALGLLALMGSVAFRGIRESAWINNVLTVLELSGLIAVIAAGMGFVAGRDAGSLWAEVRPEGGFWPILSGATLAFYAFVGFEDLANLAEEAKDPCRDIPRAILTAVAVSTALYMTVILAVLWTIGPAGAAASSRPLLDVIEKSGFAVPAPAFALIALFAVCNTGLANFIMASRLLYGLSGEGLAPAWLGSVHPERRTPWAAILFTGGACAALVVSGGVKVLAQTTSLLLVVVFGTLHAGLVKVRREAAHPPFRAPAWVPWAGLMACGFLLLRFPAGAFLRLAVVAAAGGAAYRLCRRPK